MLDSLTLFLILDKNSNCRASGLEILEFYFFFLQMMCFYWLNDTVTFAHWHSLQLSPRDLDETQL